MNCFACKPQQQPIRAGANHAFSRTRCLVRAHVSPYATIRRPRGLKCTASSDDTVPATLRVRHLAAGALMLAAACDGLLTPGAAQALAVHMEPSNALSLPTWAIHVSSVLEWVTAMGLMWKFAEATDNPRWKGMAWGMVPSLGSAMAACTWHFFYNSPDLEFLVVLQSALTVVGNCTCWWAAYRIYEAAVAEKSSA